MTTYATGTARAIVCSLVVLLAVGTRSQAEDLQRIRTTSPYIQAMLPAITGQSVTMRSIVLRIAASNVIVYVTCERFATNALDGRTIWAEANGPARYLRVQVDCMLPRASFVRILGHELQHVAEVADAPEVVDSPSFVKLFQTIGYATCDGHKSEQFETKDALAAGDRVRLEFLHRWPVGARVVANTRSRVPAE